VRTASGDSILKIGIVNRPTNLFFPLADKAGFGKVMLCRSPAPGPKGIDVTAAAVSPDTTASDKPKKPNTAAFKLVPPSREERDRIKSAAVTACAKLDRSKPLSRDDCRNSAEQLLADLQLEPGYLGFAMVLITNEFWKDHVAAIPFDRRLFLLPHCLKNAEGCPAEYDEFGLDCKKCGACSVADFKGRAEDLGYKVLVSEGTPIVLKIIVSGHVDAIVGVACLNVLEKAFDKILLAGIPCYATPLLSSNCKNTSVDQDWVMESIELKQDAAAQKTTSYMHLMRAANSIFDEAELATLAPKLRASGSKTDPLTQHEEIAYDFLIRGGKRARPFITLAVYDALSGGHGTESPEGLNLSDSVKRTALAIETFHKASLVHDDIQDDDSFRYGVPTLHRTHGVGVGINVGDYLIGLGYRLVSRDRKLIGAEAAADILDKLAESHMRLSEGQGAELIWRDSPEQAIAAMDALKIYALKTSPAFEAALYCGARLAGPVEADEKLIAEFARNIGVAFQILNDIQDWVGDEHNKLVVGQDLLAARPTLLLALALEGSKGNEKAELLAAMKLAKSGRATEETLNRVRQLYFKADVFGKADKLVEKFRAKAESLADDVDRPAFRELLYYIIDTVLEKGTLPAEPETITFGVQLGVPVRAAG
jgi:geranylgeranyl pyrophosphate synthase